jgi:hypothetical protein
MYQWSSYKFGGFNSYGGYWLRDCYYETTYYPYSYSGYYFKFRTSTGVDIDNINTNSGRATIKSSYRCDILYSVRLIQDVQ